MYFECNTIDAIFFSNVKITCLLNKQYLLTNCFHMNKLLCIPKDFLDEYDAYPILIQQLPNIISDLSYS